MSHGADAAAAPVAPAYQESARTLATSPIEAPASTGTTQTVTTAIQTKRVSAGKTPPLSPSAISASASAQAANWIRAKPAARITGSASAATGKKASPAPIATAVAKITPIARRSQTMRTFRSIGQDCPVPFAARGIAFRIVSFRWNFVDIFQKYETIPRSRQYPKILWIDDAEVVGDGITKASPVLGDFVAQEIERDVRELSACGVAFVVRYIPVHETP